MRSALERELAELVAARQVQARIDSHAKVLYARLANPRSATFANALRISAHQKLIALHMWCLNAFVAQVPACPATFANLLRISAHRNRTAQFMRPLTAVVARVPVLAPT